MIDDIRYQRDFLAGPKYNLNQAAIGKIGERVPFPFLIEIQKRCDHDVSGRTLAKSRSPQTMPYHPCMVYLPTFTIFYHTNQPNVGKYTIHGSYGILYITWMTWVCQNEINGGVFFPSFQVMRESRSERKGMKKAQKQVPLYRDYNRDHPSPGFDHPSRVF